MEWYWIVLITVFAVHSVNLILWTVSGDYDSDRAHKIAMSCSAYYITLAIVWPVHIAVKAWSRLKRRKGR